MTLPYKISSLISFWDIGRSPLRLTIWPHLINFSLGILLFKFIYICGARRLQLLQRKRRMVTLPCIIQILVLFWNVSRCPNRLSIRPYLINLRLCLVDYRKFWDETRIVRISRYKLLVIVQSRIIILTILFTIERFFSFFIFVPSW